MIKDLKKRTLSELSSALLDLKLKLRDLRFKSKGARLRDDKEMRSVKKEIARHLTVINMKVR